jgi:hypothetical protein
MMIMMVFNSGDKKDGGWCSRWLVILIDVLIRGSLFFHVFFPVVQ